MVTSLVTISSTGSALVSENNRRTLDLQRALKSRYVTQTPQLRIPDSRAFKFMSTDIGCCCTID
jgi:hypothetical protein